MISWFEKHNKLSWAITIFIAMIIFYMSSRTFAPDPSVGRRWQPIAYHFYAFLFLSAFLLISMIKGKPENKKLIITAIIIAVLYGISDEFHQFFVPGRDSSISDVLTDSAGILFAGVLYSLYNLRKFQGAKSPKEEYYDEVKAGVLG